MSCQGKADIGEFRFNIHPCVPQPFKILISNWMKMKRTFATTTHVVLVASAYILRCVPKPFNILDLE